MKAVVLLVLVLFIFLECCCKELIYVQVMTRHGAKVPSHPMSPTDNTVWDCAFNTLDNFSEDVAGSVRLDRIYRKRYMRNRQLIKGNCSEGQLTSVGSQQHVLNGQYFRKRYMEQNKLLSQQYNAREIYIRSTDMDRTIHSAQSLMRGLYPEIKGSMEKLQAIEIETCDLNNDNLYSPPCNAKTQICDKIQNSTEWNNFFSKYQSLQQKLDKIYNSSHAFFSFDEFFTSLIAKGLPLPMEVDKSTVDLVGNLSAMQMKMLYGNHEVSRLSIGVFVTDFLRDLENRMSNVTTTKFCLYSAHDTTVGQLLNLMQLFDQNPIWPPFAAHVEFEYWRDNNGLIFVEAYYQGKQLSFPQCGGVMSCPLEQFVSYLKKVALTPEQWSSMCGSSGNRRSANLGDSITTNLCA